MSVHVEQAEDGNVRFEWVDEPPLMTSMTGTTTRIVGVPFCPDLLAYEDIGAADNARGRVVRAFFWLLRWWKP